MNLVAKVVQNELNVPITVHLTPNCPRPTFCLFLKFGQAIKVRVLMLNFETSCTNRTPHNEYENLICAKKSFVEKQL